VLKLFKHLNNTQHWVKYRAKMLATALRIWPRLMARIVSPTTGRCTDRHAMTPDDQLLRKFKKLYIHVIISKNKQIPCHGSTNTYWHLLTWRPKACRYHGDGRKNRDA